MFTRTKLLAFQSTTQLFRKDDQNEKQIQTKCSNHFIFILHSYKSNLFDRWVWRKVKTFTSKYCKARSEMRHFKDQYYYLKNIRWILNNTLADTTIGTSNKRNDFHPDKEGITIQDLEKWSEYKLNRLADETRTHQLADY